MFDYIVVGGGVAGATVASRLSEQPGNRVALIEAGGDGKGMLTTIPAGLFLTVPGHLGRAHNWRFETEPQAGLAGRRIYCPRGRGLGGSSNINAMIYTRGHRRDYDNWADLGCTGWSWDEVLPFFKKSENNSRGASEFHGAEGPAHVSDLRSPRPITRAFVEAAGKVLGHSEDINAGDTQGATLPQAAQFHDTDRRGQRCSSAGAFLYPNLGRKNLEIMTQAQASRVLIENGRATGVVFRQAGEEKVVFAAREVILCAGAIQSPQLLMLSGVGPQEDLRQLGVFVKQDSPDVGRNLCDHIDQTLHYRARTSDLIALSLGATLRFPGAFAQWWRDGRGLLSSSSVEGLAFGSSGEATADWPDLELMFIVARVEDQGRKLRLGNAVSGHVTLLRPRSKGAVRLASRDPNEAPLIDPAYLTDHRDLDDLLKGVSLLRRVFSSAPLSDQVGEPIGVENLKDDEDWRDHLRDTADTVFHPVGTCRMGPDASSVVDPRLRVRGVDGLRVADASIMPQITSANTAAPSMMIGEKAASMISDDARI